MAQLAAHVNKRVLDPRREFVFVNALVTVDSARISHDHALGIRLVTRFPKVEEQRAGENPFSREVLLVYWSAGVDEGGDDFGRFGEVDASGIDHEVVGDGVFDGGVEVRAYVAFAGKVAFGVVGEGVGFVHLLQPGHVSGAMVGWSDEADMHAVVNRGGAKIGPAADEDSMTAASETAHEFVGFLHEIPEVWMQADEFTHGCGDFRNPVLGQKAGQPWR